MNKKIWAISLVLCLIIVFTSIVVNGSVFESSSGDYDAVYYSNTGEYVAYSFVDTIELPTTYTPPPDSDTDGMPDEWETTYGLNSLINDADNDADNDGISNLHEYYNNSIPISSDSDNDGLLDSEEALLSGDEFRINSDDTYIQHDVKIATNGDNYFVVWRSGDNANTYSEICGQLYDNDGNKIGTEFKIISNTTSFYHIDSITSDGNNYLLTFSKESSWGVDDRQIYAQLYDNEGNTIGTQFKVSAYSGYETNSEVASNGGNYFVTWSTLDRDGNGYSVYGQLIDNDGFKIGQDFRINTYTYDDHKFQSIATDGNIYVIAWISDYKIQGLSFDNEGTPIGSAFTIDPCGETHNVNIAVSSTRCFISWTCYDYPFSYDVYGQILDKNGNQEGSFFKINTYTPNDQYLSNVASMGNDFLTVWSSMGKHFYYNDPYEDVFVRRYDSMGNAISRDYPINDTDVSYQLNPHIVSNGKSIFAVWISDQLNNNSGRVYGKLLTWKYDTNPLNPDSDNDGLTDGEEVNNYNTMPSNPDTDNDGLPDGWEIENNTNPLVADSFLDDDNDGLSVFEEYLNGTSITNPDTDNDGLLDSQELFVDELHTEEFQINTHTIDYQRNPNVTTDGSNYLVAWQSYGQDGNAEGVYGQLFNSNGNKIGNEIHISTRTSDDQKNPYAASNGDNYFVTWQSYNQDGSEEGVYGQILDLSGNKIGSEFRINSVTNYSQRNTSISSDGNNYFVAWQSYNQDGSYQGVYGQFYDSAGNKTGSEFRINSYTNNSQNDADIASNGNSYFVTWHSNQQDGSAYGVYGQLYSLSGDKIGSEFRVNSHTDNDQKYSNISTNGTDYFVTWYSQYQDGDGYGIHGQLYSSEGNKIGSEFQINSYTTNYQLYPVSASIGDDFLVTWQSDGQDGSGKGVYGQFYTSTGEKKDSEFLINEYTNYSQEYPCVASNGKSYFIAWESYWQDGDDDAIIGKIITFGTDPLNPDSDNDGLLDGKEKLDYLTNPLNDDSDGDYLSDGYEILTSLTDPLNQDTDNDGMPDGWEINNNLNPLIDDSSGDYDNDGLSNLMEYQSDTYAHISDSDNDAMPDGWEVNNNLNPLIDDSSGDYDEDYLSNLEEYHINTNPNLIDTDDDGVLDGEEYRGRFIKTETDSVEDLLTFAIFGDEISIFSVFQYRDEYTSGSEIVGVVQYNNGDLIKDPFLVNTYTTSSQIYPFLGTNHNGYFVAWQSYNQDGSDYGIYGKFFDQYGNQLGIETLVNTHTTGAQTNPSVASTGTNYLVTWTSDNNIRAQYYSNSRYKVGVEFTVNTITSGTQRYSTVAATNSRYLVTWEHETPAGDYDIYGQIIDNNGQKIGSQFRINSYTQGNQTKPFVESNHTNFLVAWRSSGHENNEERIYARYINNDGQPESDEFYIYSGSLQDYTYPPSPAIMTDYHNYEVIWYEKNSNVYTVYSHLIINVQPTNPTNPDTDNDGLIDSVEFDGIVSSAVDPDTDNDGMFDGWEHNNGLNPKNDDSVHDNDGDNLTHLQEYYYDTNPFNADTDNDGIRDDIEIQNGLDPLVADSLIDYDNDGLTNLNETIYNTNPFNADSDNDGIPDGWEIQNGLNPNNNDSLHDNDGDSLTNLDEYNNNTNPFNDDTDGDGLSDREEILVTNTNPLNSDTDNDGLKDNFEVLYSNTNPSLADSDNDGLTDNEELLLITQQTQLSLSGINTNPDIAYNGMNHLLVWKNKSEDSGNYKIQGRLLDDSSSPVTDTFNIDEYSGLNEVENSFNLPTGYYLDLNNPSLGNYMKQACRFTASDTYPCKKIELKLQKKGNPAGQIWISLYTDGLYYPGAQIVQSVKISAESVSVTGDWIEFTFDQSQSIVAGATYWIVLDSDYPAGANCVAWEWNNTSAQKNWCFYNGAWANYASYTVGALYKVYSSISPDLPENKMIPAVAADSQSYLVVWQSYRYNAQAVPYYGIFGQLVDSSGNLFGLPLLINTNTQIYQNNPVVASDNQGYCVAWEFHDNDGIIDIHYQYLNTDGSKNGSEEIFLENAKNPVIASNGQEYFIRYDDPANPNEHQACIISNGLTYLALEEKKNDSDTITGEFIDGNNQPVGPEFVFTFDSSLIWKNPSINFCNAKYMVAWEKLNQNDKLDISAQFIDEQGTKIEDKLDIANSLQINQQSCEVDANSAGFIVTWESEVTGTPRKEIYSSFIKWGLGTDPLLADTDNDGVSDGAEISIHNCDPKNEDTDNDGITDGDEINIHNTIPTLTDTDNDGLPDGDEIFNYSSNPVNPDTDNDGMNDGDEVKSGMEPDNADSLFQIIYWNYEQNINQIILQWQGSKSNSDLPYKILWNDNLSLPWNEAVIIPDDIHNNNGIRSWIDEGDNDAVPPRPQPTNATNRFYKVIVE